MLINNTIDDVASRMVEVGSALQEHLNLRHTFRIKHPAVKRALECMAEAYANRVRIGARRGVLIHGESRAGKSTCLDLFAASFSEYMVDGVPQRTLLRLTFPSSTSPSQVMEDLLRDLGDPFPARGSVSTRRDRFQKLLTAQGVRVIVFDEAQQIMKRNKDVLQKITDWLKELMDRYGLVLILAGLDITTDLIAFDPQVQNRFYTPVQLKAFGGQVETDVTAVRVILRAIEKHYPAAKDANLSSTITATRMVLATKGLLGLIVDIVERAGEYAIRDRRNCIVMADLADAFELLVHTQLEGLGNPFRAPPDRIVALFDAGAAAQREPTGEVMRKRVRAKKREIKVSDLIAPA